MLCKAVKHRQRRETWQMLAAAFEQGAQKGRAAQLAPGLQSCNNGHQ
jgi:uncharacterized protein HemY